MWHWVETAVRVYLLHPLTAKGYQWWSGAGSDLGEIALCGAILGVFRTHNCHVRHCWRIGRHPVEGTAFKVCRLHHPDVPDRGATVHEIHAAHRARNGPR